VDEAARRFAAAADVAPESAELRHQAFSFALAAGDYEEALRQAEALVRLGESQPFVGLLFASEALRRGDLGRADAILERVDAGVYSAAVVDLSRAWIAADRRGPDAAIELLKSPGYQVYRGFHDLHRGLLAEAAGRPDEADAALARAAEGPAARLAAAYRALAAERRGDAEAASDLYRELSEAPGLDGFARAGLARIGRGDPAPAGVDGAASGAALAFYNLGAATFEQALDAYAMAPPRFVGDGPPRLETPLTFARLAVRLDPDFDEAWTLIGAIAGFYENQPEAAAAYARVGPDALQHAAAVLGRARALALMGRTEEAIAAIGSAAARDPHEDDYVLPLADLLSSAGRPLEALALVSERAEAARAEGEGDWRFELAAGALLLEADRTDPAIAALRRAAALAPSEPEALNYLGYTLADQGRDLDEAFRLLSRAVALAPGSGSVVDSYGWAYFRRGDYDSAVRQLENAVRLDPTSPVITDHLGDAYWRTGREREAVFEWRRALDLDPEPELAETIREKVETGLPLDAD